MPRDFGSQAPLYQETTQFGCVNRGEQAVGSRGVYFVIGERGTTVIGAGPLIYSGILHKQAARFGEEADAEYNMGVKLRCRKLYLGVSSGERDRKKLRSQLSAILSGGCIISRENFYKFLRGISRIVVEGPKSGDQNSHMLQNTLIGKIIWPFRGVQPQSSKIG